MVLENITNWNSLMVILKGGNREISLDLLFSYYSWFIVVVDVALVGMRNLCGIFQEVRIHAGFKSRFQIGVSLLLHYWLICFVQLLLKMLHQWR